MWAIGLVGVLGAVALAGPVAFRMQDRQPATTAIARPVDDDAGDRRATTTYDGPLVRRRTAIAVHPVRWADREAVGRQLRAAAAAERMGPLADATFAVFSPELLKYLVPEIVVVLPERASPHDAETLMRAHRHPAVAFHLVESVLVHDLTFAVRPRGVPAGQMQERIDREGVLSATLGRYDLATAPAGVTVRYFGALLSDGQVLAVRESLARAANVPRAQVLVQPSSPGAGVELSAEPAGAGAHPQE